jgi:hypothetical protein
MLARLLVCLCFFDANTKVTVLFVECSTQALHPPLAPSPQHPTPTTTLYLLTALSGALLIHAVVTCDLLMPAGN